MPSIITRGAMSAKGFGFGASAATQAVYVEDVFSTYLYTAISSIQNIVNGIDLSTKGGLVWQQSRNSATNYGILTDTVRGVGNNLITQLTNAQTTGVTTQLSAFNTDGFTAGAYWNGYNVVSWTFRKQPKFFDVVTYTGDGNFSRQVSHNLGSVPQFVIIKRTDTSANWAVVAKISSTQLGCFYLNSTSGLIASYIGNYPSSSVFVSPTTFGPEWFTAGGFTQAEVNASGGTYVAYLFADQAGGFGASGTDSVVACGSLTTDSNGFFSQVNLGWEPQLILLKNATSGGPWYMLDTMRGLAVAQNSDSILFPNNSNAETTSSNVCQPTATGFVNPDVNYGANQNMIYLAIRRGPMKTPTDATKVYATQTYGGGGTAPPGFISGFPVDLGWYKNTTSVSSWWDNDRLRGQEDLFLNSTATANSNTASTFDYENGYYNIGGSGSQYRSWMFRRAPGFFDVVCYTGTGVARNINHNLGVPPELIITKSRSGVTQFWCVFPTNFAPGSILDFSNAPLANYGGYWSSAPTSTTYNIETDASINYNTATYVSYLFATCPGVSKFGSYTGTGAAQNIDCGFAASARFILIKCTSSSGNWYLYDSARGISSSNDPYLLIDSSDPQVTGTDYVNAYASGFALTSSAVLNANGGTYIFLAIA